MNRKDFVKFFLLAIALIIGPKNVLSLLAAVSIESPFAEQGHAEDDGAYNSGSYNG